MDKCTSCGETAVETDDHNGEIQRVCKSCGVVQERSCKFSNEGDSNYIRQGKHLFENQAAPLSIQRESRPKSSEGRRQGYRKMTVLASQFHLTPGMKKEVFNFYDTAMLDKTVLMWRLERKTILAGCCVYAIMRQHDWPVNINQICNATDCSRVEFSKTYFKMVKLLHVPVVSAPIEDLVERFVNECKYLETAEKTVLTSRVHGILKIAKDCWISEGRPRRSLLLIVIYVAWQSLDFKRSRISLNDFCNRMDFVSQPSMIKRKQELFELLCGLGNKIPWYESDPVKPSNLYKHLEDILKYSEALLHDSSCERSGMKRQTKPTETRDKEPELSLDFSDKEIDSYIRSKEEVNFILKMNDHLSNS